MNSHTSTRAGLKIIDRSDAVLWVPLSRWQRFKNWLRDIWTRRRREHLAQMEAFRHMRQLSQEAEKIRKTIAESARLIARQQQKAELRLAMLEQNMAVLADAQNAQADAIKEMKS